MPDPAKRDAICDFLKTIVLVIHELVIFWRPGPLPGEGVFEGEVGWGST
jgi:hypothetical protein